MFAYVGKSHYVNHVGYFVWERAPVPYDTPNRIYVNMNCQEF